MLSCTGSLAILNISLMRAHLLTYVPCRSNKVCERDHTKAKRIITSQLWLRMVRPWPDRFRRLCSSQRPLGQIVALSDSSVSTIYRLNQYIAIDCTYATIYDIARQCYYLAQRSLATALLVVKCSEVVQQLAKDHTYKKYKLTLHNNKGHGEHKNKESLRLPYHLALILLPLEALVRYLANDYVRHAGYAHTHVGGHEEASLNLLSLVIKLYKSRCSCKLQVRLSAGMFGNLQTD